MAKYMTARQLGLRAIHRDAAIKLLRLLKTNKLPGELNMRIWGGSCNTVHCIGGWIDYFAGTFEFDITVARACNWGRGQRAVEIGRLFYPMGYGGLGRKQVIKTLEHFLKTGQVVWR